MVRKKKKPVKGNKKRHLLNPVKRVKRALGITLKLVILIIGLPAILYSGYLIYGELLVYPRLDIKSININVMEKVGVEEIKRLSSIEKGQNILSVDLGMGAKAIETHPWVKSAVISRHIPETINIEVVERKPLCLVSTDALYVADEDGVIFKKYSPEDDLDLVLITGLEGAMISGAKVLDTELVKVVKELASREGFNLKMISEIHYDRVFGFSFYTIDKGVRLTLGTSGIDTKLRAFEDVSEAMGARIMDVAAMDMSDEDKVVVKLSTL